MSTQPEGQEPVRDEPTYTVQVQREGQDGLLWLDIATVQVPLRTKRRAVIAKALSEAGIRPLGSAPGPKVRVLDEDSAAVTEPEPFQPEPEWRIK